MQQQPVIADALHLFGRVEGSAVFHQSDAAVRTEFNPRDAPLSFCIVILVSLSYTIEIRMTAEQWKEFVRPINRRTRRPIPNNATDTIPNAA